MKYIDETLKLNNNEAVIYLAGGCFWGTEHLMASLKGVLDAFSGYANGRIENPNYELVCTGTTGHRETVRVVYNPSVISLEMILYTYFSSVDTTVKNRQGNDIGEQYQSGVYFADDESEKIVNKVVESIKARGHEFYTEVEPIKSFYPAEEYHQDYLIKNPNGYCHISLNEIQKAKNIIVDPAKYARPSDDEIKKMLSDEEFKVTQLSGTEPPFKNRYNDFFERGIYVDVVTGEPLFSSGDKFSCDCGWPAFSKPIDENAIVESVDLSFGMKRIELKSRVGATHLGHLFVGEGISPTERRYCIDSLSLRFIPENLINEKGYGYLLDSIVL